MSDQAKTKPPESIRGVVDELLRECRVSDERRKQYHERISKAIWRDRLDAHGTFLAANTKKEEVRSA